MSRRFETRKRTILEQLDAPDEEYHDLSPKGSVDAPIRSLIRSINHIDGLVTTSSCSGRISVFLEGRKAEISNPEPQGELIAGPGGKGGGGSWLFSSHDPVPVPEVASPSHYGHMFGLQQGGVGSSAPDVSARFIHLKFEPMILHILTASLEDSQRVLAAALNSGFRESGAMSLNVSKTGELNPMVAVRSTGYSFDAIIGYQSDTGSNLAMVDEIYLRTLVNITNERFKINSERIARFRYSLHDQYNQKTASTLDKPDWEDAEARKRRKREEGLARQRALRTSNGEASADSAPVLVDQT
ncbi:hypothetical protein K458DRAFT_291341 [Lentithecium fluviatile CBS 122367]|uniref:tRNA(Phe) 7-[(3-amino-3-carboxypropyl)-4-demethylwyosine(37)-N(4)]-methyltransferase n=1 Tax=Lentithecium fluviatile CBS 122367 TaxID=1168545 RepID=A0A6G1JGE7_9PLEO|nr:hypothetical protein K458DRAFT_291341 [Lentithecium fluviatile CBS 122367]